MTLGDDILLKKGNLGIVYYVFTVIATGMTFKQNSMSGVKSDSHILFLSTKHGNSYTLDIFVLMT